jgi:hypothetical protein
MNRTAPPYFLHPTLAAFFVLLANLRLQLLSPPCAVRLFEYAMAERTGEVMGSGQFESESEVRYV